MGFNPSVPDSSLRFYHPPAMWLTNEAIRPGQAGSIDHPFLIQQSFLRAAPIFSAVLQKVRALKSRGKRLIIRQPDRVSKDIQASFPPQGR
jgi:hypothetical protein